MAYCSQDDKKSISLLIKPILKKYGIKGTLSVSHHMTLNLNIKSGKIDFIENFKRVCGSKYPENFAINHQDKNIDVNTYWYHEHFSGVALDFLKEAIAALNHGNYDHSDIQTDYFDTKRYISVKIGQWNKPYILEA